MKTIVSVVGCKTLGCSAEDALAFIQNLERIAGYEPKINEAQISRVDQAHGEYTTVGIFSCIPWRGRFSYSLNDHGFHSHMVGGLLANNMQGGFVVLPHGNGHCQLWHYEEYRFPRATIVLRAGLQGYLRRAMHKELRDIETLLDATLKDKGGLDSVESQSEVATLNIPILPEIKSSATVADLFEGNPIEDDSEVRMKAQLNFSIQNRRSCFLCCR